MEQISPQRVLEEAIRLLESYLSEVPEDSDRVEEINSNLDDLQELIKRLYMQGIYGI